MLSGRMNWVIAAVSGSALVLAGMAAVSQEAPRPPVVPDRLPEPSEVRFPGDIPLPVEPALSTARNASKPAAAETQVAISAAGNSEAEMVTERYPDGNAKVQRQVILDPAGNYVNHGTYVEHDSHGKIVKSGEYRNGRLHGKWIRHFEEGRGRLFSGSLEGQFLGPFVAEAGFVDGQLHGSWIIKSQSGAKIIEWSFDRGIRSGKSTWWYPNGEKRLEVVYRNGMIDGDLLEWNTEGKLVNRVAYLDGRRLAKTVEWYAPGQKYYEGYYLLAQDVVEPVYDWWNGTARATPVTRVGQQQKHGPWIAWHRNGNKQIEAQYDRDLPVGKFTWWYENGQKQAEGEYQGGVKHGTWTTWHANGLKESRSEYREGNLAGKWMRWDTAGRLAETHDFNVESVQDVKKERAGLGEREMPGVIRPLKTVTAPKPRSI